MGDLVHLSLRTLVEDFGVKSFSVAMYLKPFGEDGCESASQSHIVVRMVDRGQLSEPGNDWGTIEMYGPSLVLSDIMETARALQQAVAVFGVQKSEAEALVDTPA